MSNKISNDENIKNLKLRKIYRWLIIFWSLVTIVLSILCLVIGISFVFPLITFIISTVFQKLRDNTKINKKDELSYVRKELEKPSKKKKKK